MILITCISYYLWDNNSDSYYSVLLIDEKTDLNLSVLVEAPRGKKLVPQGVILGANDVDKVVLTYYLTSNYIINYQKVNVEVLDIEIGGKSKNSDLINIYIEK